MNPIDIGIFIVLILGVIWGIYQGFIKSIAGFLSIGIAIWVGINFSDFLKIYLAKFESIPVELLHILSFALTISLTIFTIRLTAKIIHTFTHSLGLGIFNRLAGGVFGCLINLLILSALYYFIFPFFSEFFHSENLNQSKLLPYLKEVANIFSTRIFGTETN